MNIIALLKNAQDVTEDHIRGLASAMDEKGGSVGNDLIRAVLMGDFGEPTEQLLQIVERAVSVTHRTFKKGQTY